MLSNQNRDNLKSRIKSLFWTRVTFYTSESSKIMRQLAFGEGALFWYFTNDYLKNSVLVGLLFLTLFFIADSFQYILGGAFHRIEARHYEKLVSNGKVTHENQIKKREAIISPIYYCYVIKIILMACASIVLILVFVLNFFSKLNK